MVTAARSVTEAKARQTRAMQAMMMRAAKSLRRRLWVPVLAARMACKCMMTGAAAGAMVCMS